MLLLFFLVFFPFRVLDPIVLLSSYSLATIAVEITFAAVSRIAHSRTPRDRTDLSYPCLRLSIEQPRVVRDQRKSSGQYTYSLGYLINTHNWDLRTAPGDPSRSRDFSLTTHQLKT